MARKWKELQPMAKHNDRTYEGVVIQSYRTEDEAIIAIRRLQSAGFDNDQVSVIARDENVSRQVADETGTEAEEGAVAGALTGGILGGVAALIAGASAVAIPGIGIAIGGPIAAAIAGAAGGGLVGALVGMGIPEDEAKTYNDRLEAGDIVVSVVAGDREVEAREILHGDGVISTNLRSVDANVTRSDIVS
jgi:hypothetical protein